MNSGDYRMVCHSSEQQVVVVNHRAPGGRALNDLEDLGISIRSAAKAMGISATYLSDLLKGRRNWSEKKAEKFTRAVRQILDTREKGKISCLP
jgi:transcriptional regulator with XRE-family HTH domain